jgi:N-acetylneuraminate synthase
LKTFIIAEAGVNHNGDIKLALQLVDEASAAGADAIKFQTFKAQNLATKKAIKAEYQSKTTSGDNTQFMMLKNLELSNEMHFEINNYCQKKGIEFLSTPFDIDSLNFLDQEIGLKKLKIPSGEITNAPLLLSFAQTNSNIIISTGMSDLQEIEEALGVLAYGFLAENILKPKPSKELFKQALQSVEGSTILRDKVTVLHCITEYPAPINEVNLKSITTLKNDLKLKVGYSDHTNGIFASLVAVSLGAEVIEKHLTLDKNLSGPDHKASLEPNEFKEMVQGIREVEQLLGDGIKRAMPSEIKNKIVARKSLVASKHIKTGEVFSYENITMKRPGNGRSPIDFWDIIGTKAKQEYEPEDLIL